MTAPQENTPLTHTIPFNWYGSNLVLAKFIENTDYYEFAENEQIGHKMSSHMLGGLLYDLGHAGRGYDDFPRTVNLKTLPITKSENERGKQIQKVQMPLGDFLGQLVPVVEDYLTNHPWSKRNGPQHLREREAFKLIAEQSTKRGVNVDLVFEDRYGDGEVITIDSIQIVRNEI